ncbi:MAG: GTP 3',8-cyclase MoaA [Leptospira sp.]|nr:GTP 3',8-cyclase MoaA [Leptospira sp.]
MNEITRKFEVLRISILSHCNFACVYCAPKNKFKSDVDTNHYHFLTPEVLETKVKLLIPHIQIKEVHLTGGEPTLHKDLFQLIQTLIKLGINDIALTSNGFFEENLLFKMKEAGLKRINFSMDSFSQSNFERLSDRKFIISDLLLRIEKAKQLGLEVKINCTVLNGYNEHEILPILQWSGERKIPIRFLEFMKMGPLQNSHHEYFFSASDIRSIISTKFQFGPIPTDSNSTANYFKTSEGYIFGMIANHTEPFCDSCNRLRMDSYGKIYGCLSDQTSFDLPNEKNDVEQVLNNAMKTKKNYFTGSELSMKYIGG